MTTDFTKQTEEMFKAAQDMAVPEGIQKALEDGLTQGKKAYSKLTDSAQEANKALEKAYETTQKSTKKITDKILNQASENTAAAFEAAEAMVQTKSVPEAFQIQSEFLKKQMEIFGNQSKEIYELTNKLATEATQNINKATSKAFEQSK
ncbi:MAG: phasin family protein [Methyloligellaceae bacterium]